MSTTFITPGEGGVRSVPDHRERAEDWVAKKCPWCGRTYCQDSACVRTGAIDPSEFEQPTTRPL